MHLIDWIIAGSFLAFMILAAVYSRRMVKSVADYLVAGRGVGKYLGTLTGLAVDTDASIIATYGQAVFVAGLAFYYSQVLLVILVIIIGLTGWVVYRLRQSRVMTINELLERRYSRRFRIFCGILCFIAGVINMGIFPVIEGTFYVYLLGLPTELTLGTLDITIPTVAVVSGLLVLISFFFCFMGGQVVLIVNDFIQGTMMLTMLIVIAILSYRLVNWQHIQEAIMSEPDVVTRLNPFATADAASFGFMFFVMMIFKQFYINMTFSPGISRNLSARDPKEAKTMYLMGSLRSVVLISLFFVPVAAYTFLKLPVFEQAAQPMQDQLNAIANPNIRAQVATTLFMRHILPIGVLGLFVGSILAMTISSFDTYMFTWGNVLIQDILGPFRKKPMSTKGHLLALKLGTAFVALFVWTFSIFFRQVDYILFFTGISVSIFGAGAGAAVIGALYWKRATTAGAWAAMITGSVMCGAGIVVKQIWENFPVSTVYMTMSSWVAAIVAYILVSLCTPNPNFDLDELLHRKSKHKN